MASAPSLLTPQQYPYQPIQYPDAIRMLDILPGEDDELLHIRIARHSLADIQKCEALSYEWGSNDRNKEIFCSGAIIRATPKVIAALRRLRQTSYAS